MGTDGISFGKGKNVDFSGFNGISKDNLNNEDAKKKKLNDAIFKKYDQNNDGVLDKGDLEAIINDVKLAAGGGKAGNLGKKEAKTYLTQTLGLTEGEYNRQDLEELLEFINADKDSISDAQTDKETGNTTITYKPDQNGQAMKEVYDRQHLLSKRFVKNNAGETLSLYTGGVKCEEIVTKSGQEPVHYTFKGEAGKEEVVSKYRQRGTVKEYLDGQDRVTNKITYKGQGLYDEVVYNYGEGERAGYVTESYFENGRSTGHVTKLGGQEVRRTDIAYDEATGQATYITTEGKYKTKTVFDKDSHMLSKVEIDDEGNPKAYEHTVDKENDTWYGIVQAKYGITDHKTIMEIVHQLKDARGIKYNEKNIPNTITLPPTITLKNGQTVELKNIDAEIDQTHNVPKHINVPKATDIPQKLSLTPEQTTVDMSQYQEPPSITIPDDKKTFDVQGLRAKYPADLSKAGQTVKASDNEYVRYDDEGKPEFIYDHEPKKDDVNYKIIIYNDIVGLADKKSKLQYYYNNDGTLDKILNIDDDGGYSTLYYDAQGKTTTFTRNLYDPNDPQLEVERFQNDGELTKHEYDAQKRKTTEYKYKDGQLTGITRFILDSAGKETRRVFYDAQGNVTGFEEKSGQKTTCYKADGTVEWVHVEKYDSKKGYSETYEYDANGNLKPQPNW